jgi:hypothetical protein
MLELLLCSVLTVLPDYLFRRAPPRDPAGFVELGHAIVQSNRIASLIKPTE